MPATSRDRDAALAARRDVTPHAVLGDGELLLTLSRRGEVEQLFWPHVDRDPHLGELRLGVLDGGTITWLDDPALTHAQRYDGDADVLVTDAAGDTLGAVTVTDLVATTGPVLVRRVRGLRHPLVVHLRPTLSGTPRAGGAYLHPGTGALVAHRRDRVLAVALDVPATGTLAEVARDPDSVDGVAGGRLRVGGIVHGEVDGALRADAVHDEVTVTVAIATTAEEALGLLADVARRGPDAVEAARRDHDARLLAAAASPVVDDPAEVALYRRSLLAFGAVSDRATGGVIAAPEQDPDFARSGGYGFVWPRDLAFILLAHLAAGRHDLARPALRWLVDAQPASGIWDQRSWTDGSLGPSWGAQLDETGAVLVAYRSAVAAIDDPDLADELWPSARRAAVALVDALDPVTGLPAPSMDLWEERTGLHAYTAAATCGGLRAAAELADARGEGDLAARWRAAADRVAAGIDVHLWSEQHGRFVRSIAVARGDAAGDPTPSAYRILDVPASPVPSIEPLDPTLDVSLLGLVYPFGVVAADDPRMRATIAAIRERLTAADGGLLRWDGDPYLGGNPWVLATLWLGLVERPPGVALPADGVAYARRVATTTDLLAEQIDADTGRPAWILPLTWSHAMYVLAVRPDPPALPARPHHAEVEA